MVIYDESHQAIEIERAQCHFLIDRLPEEALAETIEHLRDVLEFHTPAPEARSLPFIVEQSEGASGREFERPAFELDLD